MENEEVVLEDHETPEEVAEETQLSAEEIADLQEKAKVSSQNFERAKKAETELKEAREKLKTEVPANTDGLSNKDIIFLAKADIHEEDSDAVIDMARLKKIPVSEAYKFMKPILDVNAEERKTAGATQTRGSARGTSKVSGEALLAKAERTGEVPEDDDGMTELFKARLARRAGVKK